MSTGTMTIEDILKYAIQIENESHAFYRDGVKIVVHDEVKELLSQLEQEEQKHESRLSTILEGVSKDAVEGFSHESLKHLINNDTISPDATKEEVLQVALGREKNTRDFYSQVLTITNLDANIVDTFEMLYQQESGHVQKVSSMIEALKE